MPPPAPTKPQMKPTTAPQTTDFMMRERADCAAMSDFSVMTGRTMNFTPSSSVMNTEKFPMVVDGTWLET